MSACPHDYYPNNIVQDSFLYLNLRFRYARPCLMLCYRAPLPAFCWILMREILTPQPTACANPYILQILSKVLLQVVCAQVRKTPLRRLPRRKSAADSTLPPGAWSLNISKTLSLQATKIRPFAGKIVPGRVEDATPSFFS